MTQVIHILIAVYPNAKVAENSLKKLNTAGRNQGVQIIDAAVVRRDEKGKLHIHETADVGGGRGATVGGILGGVLGLVAGPAGVVVGAALGAVVGGTAAKVLDLGIRHERLEEIGRMLKPESAALVVLTEPGFEEFVKTLIRADGVEIATETLTHTSAQELRHAHDVAVKALNLGEALADGGMASPVERE